MGKPEKDPGDQKITLSLSLTPLGAIMGIAELYRRGKIDVGEATARIRLEFAKGQVDALLWVIRGFGPGPDDMVPFALKIQALREGFEVITGD